MGVCRQDVFLPVEALSKILRCILSRSISESISDGAIRLPEGISNFVDLKKKLYEKNGTYFQRRPLEVILLFAWYSLGAFP